MLAKLIVIGATREEAIERSRRALDEFVVEGMPTVIPFTGSSYANPALHRADGGLRRAHPLIETEFDNTSSRTPPQPARTAAAERQKRGRGGRWSPHRGDLPAGLASTGVVAGASRRPAGRPGASQRRPRAGDALTSPMQARSSRLRFTEGRQVEAGESSSCFER